MNFKTIITLKRIFYMNTYEYNFFNIYKIIKKLLKNYCPNETFKICNYI